LFTRDQRGAVVGVDLAGSALHPGCDGLAVNAAELHCDQKGRP
jgi:hypothetical protein